MEPSKREQARKILEEIVENSGTNEEALTRGMVAIAEFQVGTNFSELIDFLACCSAHKNKSERTQIASHIYNALEIICKGATSGTGKERLTHILNTMDKYAQCFGDMSVEEALRIELDLDEFPEIIGD